jgi:hypothetical protein
VSAVKPDILARRYSRKDVGDGELIRGGCRVSDERTHCLFWCRPQAPRTHWLSSVLIQKGVRKPADEACNFALSRLPRAPDNQPRRIISSCIHLVNPITFQRRAASSEPLTTQTSPNTLEARPVKSIGHVLNPGISSFQAPLLHPCAGHPLQCP